MPLEFRSCQASEFAKVIEFYREHWSANHIFVKDPDFMRWQFNPQRSDIFEDSDLSAITIWDTEKERLAGFQGLISCDFKVLNQIVPGYWLCNLSLDPDYRQTGIGIRLLHKSLKLPVNVVATAGIHPDIFKFYRSMKYHTQERLNRFIKIVDAKSAEKLIGKNFKTLPIGKIQKPSTNGGYVFEKVKALPTQWDDFWDDITNGQYIGVHRDSHYMTWRYVEHPRLTYSIALLKDRANNKILGYSVYRIEQVADSDIQIFRLIEIMAYQHDQYRCLLSNLENIAFNNQVALIDHYSNQSPHQFQEKSGWFQENSCAEVIVPSLFQPLYHGAHHISAAVKIVGMESDIQRKLDSNLYIVKSDGDQDRPN